MDLLSPVRSTPVDAQLPIQSTSVLVENMHLLYTSVIVVDLETNLVNYINIPLYNCLPAL